jgi:hypothetical protein
MSHDTPPGSRAARAARELFVEPAKLGAQEVREMPYDCRVAFAIRHMAEAHRQMWSRR